MKVLIDQNLPVLLAEWLLATGHEARHVRLLGMAAAEDQMIVSLAKAHGEIVITRDGDLQYVAEPPPGAPQVVWVRVGNTTNPDLIIWWEKVWPGVEAALRAGEALIEVR